MTIELGWPWWVSSGLAAGVAIGCVIAFVVQRRPAVRGVLATLAVQGVAIAVAAPLLMRDGGTGMSGMDGGSVPGGALLDATPSAVAAPTEMPFTFYFTHYEFLGDPDEPSGVRYHSSGKPFAQAPDGSTITMSGAGGWDPAIAAAAGGGEYVITDPEGRPVEHGTWTVTGFVSFEQLPGWLGIPGLDEEGWQGPPGSPSFAGFLEVRVELEGLGEGLLTAWCLMPETPMPGDHVSDGITLTGGGFDFSDYHETERTLEGVMFYGPSSGSG